jgi:hypothetical protein
LEQIHIARVAHSIHKKRESLGNRHWGIAEKTLKIMDDQTKLALFDALLAYLIHSAATMGETVNALAPDSLHAGRVECLNESLVFARILLTQV